MLRSEPKKVSLGLIIISVVMFFAAFAIDIFWLVRFVGKAFPSTIPVDPVVYNAMAAPDIILSIFLYVGAFGLIKLKKYGLVASLVAMGMWLFDALFILGITKTIKLNIVVFSLAFAVFTIVYLWKKRELFY
ncbi:MAG: hypothetical protein GTO16_09460 [Candidatus Aminicenantes bacterium]|nr:hypothetical protein [Candidatus Aminicenantes bacterium]